MTSDSPVWVGADPGGKGCFGLAILRNEPAPETYCVDCADDAIRKLVRVLGATIPAGAGVDAPLWWSAGRSGDREADRWLRRTHKLSGGAVQAANSLKGAALVQGLMFIELLRATFGPAIPVTEVHPKALLKVMTGGNWLVFAARHGLNSVPPTEHERDAVIGCVAAREGFSGRWPIDLSVKRLPEEQDPHSYWLAPVHYYWPAA